MVILEVKMFDAAFNEDAYQRLRMCAAYIHLTGSWTSHTRPATDAWLRIRTWMGPHRAGLGPFRVNQSAVEELALRKHPMVGEVRKRQRDGYRIGTEKDLDACPETQHPRRRVPHRIYMIRGDHRIIVQGDGS